MIEVEPVLERGPVLRLRVARDVPLLQPYHTAAFWVDGLLVDTGCAHTADEFLQAVSSLRVEQVVNTHSHEDHIGANAAVEERFGCPIRAHPLALPVIADPRRERLQPYRLIYWGRPRPSSAEGIGEMVETDRFRFQVIHTPGHSPDSICLFEPEQGWLFTGDAYTGGKDRALREGYDIHGIIASLRRLARLPVSAVFSGSGSVRESGTAPLEEKAAYLEEMGERVQALHGQGLSPRRIARRLFGREMRIAYITLGHFSGVHLVRSYLAAPSSDLLRQ